MSAAARQVDVAVVGDGPAGSALAAALHRRGVDVVLVGDDAAWTATYGVWVDELVESELELDGLLAWSSPWIGVHALGHRRVPRAYAVLDNHELRLRLRDGVEHLVVHVDRVERAGARRRVVGATTEFDARLVIDATGWPGAFATTVDRTGPAWQTAFGAVLAQPPPGELGEPMLMDLRLPHLADRDTATFAYALPVADGWLVEETVLAARPAIEPVALVDRLAARLGLPAAELLATAVRTETVHIPMGGALPEPGGPAVPFGAAAGHIHPATGYSVATSLRRAPRVATAVASALARPADPSPAAWSAVWPMAARRTRVLHDYGLETLLRLDSDETREFFEAFFELPAELWHAYLQPDAPPRAVSAAMARLFAQVSWPLRRRLTAGNPLGLLRLLRG